MPIHACGASFIITTLLSCTVTLTRITRSAYKKLILLSISEIPCFCCSQSIQVNESQWDCQHRRGNEASGAALDRDQEFEDSEQSQPISIRAVNNHLDYLWVVLKVDKTQQRSHKQQPPKDEHPFNVINVAQWLKSDFHKKTGLVRRAGL